MKRLAAGVLMIVLAGPLFACPRETVTYGPFTVRQLSGRIVSYDEAIGGEAGEGEVRGVAFLVRAKGDTSAPVQRVQVLSDGRFSMLHLADGVYDFTITMEHHIFTMKGEVTISRDAAEESIELNPPYCG